MLPSFEQFLALVEGLYRIGSNLLAERKLYLLEDNPGKHLYLLAQINGEPMHKDHLRLVCRSKRLAGTNVDITCYITGAPYAANYAELVEVEQLKIRETMNRLI